jgi:hypothetical protein
MALFLPPDKLSSTALPCDHAPSPLLVPPPCCRGAISDIPAAEAEYELVFKVIAYLLRKEGLLTVTGAPKRQEAEEEDSFRDRLLKERRLALSANFVPEA